MLWFNFILALNFIFLCFWVCYCMIMILKQKKIKFKPRIKLNHNTYINAKFAINLLLSYKRKISQKVRKVIME